MFHNLYFQLMTWFMSHKLCGLSTQQSHTLPGVGFRQNAREALDRAPVERGFFCSQAKADNFRNMKYIAKIKIILRSVLTVFQNHFTASGSPVDFVPPTIFSG